MASIVDNIKTKSPLFLFNQTETRRTLQVRQIIVSTLQESHFHKDCKWTGVHLPTLT